MWERSVQLAQAKANHLAAQQNDIRKYCKKTPCKYHTYTNASHRHRGKKSQIRTQKTHPTNYTINHQHMENDTRHR